MHMIIADFPFNHLYTPEKPQPDHFVQQEWMEWLSFKMQTVLLCALRGYDGINKADPSKPFIKILRQCTLRNADSASNFMQAMILRGGACMNFFENEFHKYPMHWCMHFLHAYEILGFYYPAEIVRKWFMSVYLYGCHVLHVNPETKDEMDSRLK